MSPKVAPAVFKGLKISAQTRVQFGLLRNLLRRKPVEMKKIAVDV